MNFGITKEFKDIKATEEIRVRVRGRVGRRKETKTKTWNRGSRYTETYRNGRNRKSLRKQTDSENRCSLESTAVKSERACV